MDINILNRFINNECSVSEKKEVEEWLKNAENDLFIKEWMSRYWDTDNLGKLSMSDEPDLNRIRSIIQERISLENESNSSLNKKSKLISISRNANIRFAAAAAIIFVIISSASFWFFERGSFNNSLTNNNKILLNNSKDIAPPTGNNAILTLANGEKLNLDSTKNGVLAKEGNINVRKNANGEIVYTGKAADAITYNTLSLPKGSKPFRLVLADGTFVWLNAASSVTFPTAFIGHERRVKITGEAYFEVAKNVTMPFFVVHEDAQVRVLGTHFDVNTYADEKDMKVTLLEGSVNVSKGALSIKLSPGQQAKLTVDNISLLPSIDVEEVMAWKNGKFYFKGTDLRTIMRQIEKYYNVEVVFKDEVNYQFYAKIDRQKNLSEFLKKLELTNLVHFNIENNKVIVTK